MGMDATARICYGIAFRDLPEFEPFPRGGDEEDKITEWYEWEELYKRETGKKAWGECPVTITINYGNEQMAVYIKDSGVYLDWDYGVAPVKPIFEIDPQWDSQIEEFCKIMSIPFSQPEWIGWATFS